MHYDARRFQTSLLKEIEATTRRVLWPQPADKQVDKISNNPHDILASGREMEIWTESPRNYLLNQTNI